MKIDTGKRKILIIDDEPTVVRLFSLRLNENGYKTYCAYDSYQGIKLAKDVLPDLILLDLEMPAGGGVAVFDNLKASVYTSSIPIIVVSGVPSPDVENLVLKMGADSFFSKPLDFNDLLKKMEELLKIN